MSREIQNDFELVKLHIVTEDEELRDLYMTLNKRRGKDAHADDKHLMKYLTASTNERIDEFLNDNMQLVEDNFDDIYAYLTKRVMDRASRDKMFTFELMARMTSMIREKEGPVQE